MILLVTTSLVTKWSTQKLFILKQQTEALIKSLLQHELLIFFGQPLRMDPRLLDWFQLCCNLRCVFRCSQQLPYVCPLKWLSPQRWPGGRPMMVIDFYLHNMKTLEIQLWRCKKEELVIYNFFNLKKEKTKRDGNHKTLRLCQIAPTNTTFVRTLQNWALN